LQALHNFILFLNDNHGAIGGKDVIGTVINLLGSSLIYM